MTSVFCILVTILYAIKGAAPSTPVETFLGYAPVTAVVLWLYYDMVSRGPQVQDLGLFLCFAWPVVLPWHIFRTRQSCRWLLTFEVFSLVIAPAMARAIADVFRMLR